MARAKQPVSVGGIEFDALIDSEENYESEVPEYPTEKGFKVSDTIVLKATVLNMTLFVTDTPVTWKGRLGSGPGKTEAVVKRLKEMYFKKLPVEVITSDAVYSNMAVTSLSIKKTAEVEGYMNDSVKKELDVIEKLLKHNLGHDLDNNRDDIVDILAGEIIKRYYYQEGQVIQTLKRDAALDSAAVILNDKVRYTSILSPRKKS